MNKQRNNKKRRSGVAATEMVLVTPFIVLLFFGAVELGQIVNLSQAVSNASREGARKSSRAEATSTSSIEQAIHQYLLDESKIPSSEITITFLDKDNQPISEGNLTTIPSGEQLTVRVSVDYADIRWINMFSFLNNYQISSATAIRRE